MGDKQTTNLSSFNLSLTYTANKQTFARMINQVYTPDNKFYITGSVLWGDAPGLSYGIGGNTDIDDGFTIDRGSVKLNESILYNIISKFYFGPQFTLDRRYKIKPSDDAPDGETEEEYQETLENSWYSYAYGTDGNAYTVLGVGVMALFDSRDNVNSPYKGYYLNANYQYFGEDYHFHVTNLDLRHYIQIPNKRNILALWFLANFTQGETPYDSLPANGIDQLSTSARGYTARRYTGENYLYFEAEYRRNIYKWFGMTGFANVHSVTEQETDEFLYYNPGGGVDLGLSSQSKQEQPFH